MIKKLILTCSLLVAIAIASGCSRQPTVRAAEFGAAVRDVFESQIHDNEAALHRIPDAVEGSDPDRLNAVVDAYREGATTPLETPQRPINVSIGGQ